MSRQKPIQINIPHPCSQNWDEMTPSGNGRFCEHCQKTVIDFTTYSDASLHNFFSTGKEHVCGRFISTQVNRPLSIPAQPHSRLYRIAMAMGLTILAAQGPALSARPRPPLTEHNALISPPDSTISNRTDTAFASLSGKVVDMQNRPVTDAFVQVYRDSIAVGSAYVDTGGNFLIEPLLPGVYEVIVFNGWDEPATQKGLNIISKNTEIAFAIPYRRVRHVMGDYVSGEDLSEERTEKNATKKTRTTKRGKHD